MFLTSLKIAPNHAARTGYRRLSTLDRDCAANTCHDIEWENRRRDGCASSSLSYGAAMLSSTFMKITSSHAAITHLRISKLIAESEGNGLKPGTGEERATRFSFSFLFETGRPRGPAFSAGGPGRSSDRNRYKKAARRLLGRAAGVLIDARAHLCAGMLGGA
jgi:hypothetical protein